MIGKNRTRNKRFAVEIELDSWLAPSKRSDFQAWGYVKEAVK
jgi:hypothetical protein